MRHADLLFELGTEELPPTSLATLSASLVEHVGDALAAAELAHDGIEPYATPRRLALIVRNLADKQPDQVEERRGPAAKVAYADDGTPGKAALGFARSAGVAFEDLTEVETDKGPYLVARIERAGKPVQALVPPILERALASLPIERRMRWGASRDEFVRPVHWAVLLYGNDVVPATILGHATGGVSQGHRFMTPGPVKIESADDYVEALRSRHVMASFDERRQLIARDVATAGVSAGGTAIIEPALLDEVTALVEWPCVLTGRFDARYLDVPREVLISAMAKHQRYFHVLDDADALLPVFLTVANIASSNPQTVISGNERVIKPRLADAEFFYQKDREHTLAAHAERLGNVLFHAKLGSYGDKVRRVTGLATRLAEIVGENVEVTAEAASLCKADLVTDMVDEFTDLQGTMGGYYARSSGCSDAVATAISEHYRPVQSGGALPSTVPGCLVAIADKVDNLVGLFGIGEPPTGSKDPYALRRAVLGMLRIVVERGLELDIDVVLTAASEGYPDAGSTDDARQYLLERLDGWYGSRGIGSDIVDACVGGAASPTHLVDLDSRIHALAGFLDSPEAGPLAAANKRVANILKDQVGEARPDPARFSDPAEHELFEAITLLAVEVGNDVEARAYGQALSRLASLRPAIDAYFEAVMVMSEDAGERANRIATLSLMRNLFLRVADFSLLQS